MIYTWETFTFHHIRRWFALLFAAHHRADKGSEQLGLECLAQLKADYIELYENLIIPVGK